MIIKNRKRHKYFHSLRLFFKRLNICILFILIFLGHTSVTANAIITNNQWRTLAPGLTYKPFTPKELSPFATLHVFDIDLIKINIRFCPIKQLMTAAESARVTNAIMAFNGAFFSKENTPLGLRVSNGEILSPFKKISWWQIFSIQQSQAKIGKIKQKKLFNKLSFAIQAGPILIKDNKIVSLKEGLAARTALGLKNNGHVMVVISEHTLITTTFIARFMKQELSCYDALNLDGGSSTQLYVNIPNVKQQVLGLVKLPDPICLFSN